MDTVSSLIDDAAKVCSTKTKVAHALGVSPQNLQAVYRGDRGLTQAQALKLAQITGKDACQVWAVVSLEREPDPVKREELREGFFRAVIRGVAAFCLIAATLGTGDERAGQVVGVDRVYIGTSWRRLREWLRRRGFQPLTSGLRPDTPRLYPASRHSF